ncbi:hypothetical protein PENANT_c029G01611 [Penicillium antarcticum]|uniref:Uncharacterized protein n=1 Tax=Penicillium antarcticum TaxID=416450 RepID=A0A1V6PWK8_9EURO|nr:hypothetical protein PENANT_c029G01611 [Penicillium antarcticum]
MAVPHTSHRFYLGCPVRIFLRVVETQQGVKTAYTAVNFSTGLSIKEVIVVMRVAEQSRLSRSVPRLRGKSDWIFWEERLLFVLADFNILGILTGKRRCSLPLVGQGMTEAKKAKQNHRIATWKVEDLKVRVWLGSTLDDEPASHVTDIFGVYKAYQTLIYQYEEKGVKSNARCWAE